MLDRGSGVDLDALQAAATDGRAVQVLPEPTPGTFFERQVVTIDGLVDCCPASFTDAIDRCRHLFDETRAEVTEMSNGPASLRLIHRRDAWMHNSWFANVPSLKRGGRTNNPLGIHPADAADLGLADGDAVSVASRHGEIDTVVQFDPALMRGVVSMVHGWGHAASPRLRVAAEHPGANPNALLPTGEGSYEPLSSQAHMTGIPVRVLAHTS
jgi:anaerobic selenocysteine-containing dehydrogenase